MAFRSGIGINGCGRDRSDAAARRAPARSSFASSSGCDPPRGASCACARCSRGAEPWTLRHRHVFLPGRSTLREKMDLPAAHPFLRRVPRRMEFGMESAMETADRVAIEDPVRPETRVGGRRRSPDTGFLASCSASRGCLPAIRPSVIAGAQPHAWQVTP